MRARRYVCLRLCLCLLLCSNRSDQPLRSRRQSVSASVSGTYYQVELFVLSIFFRSVLPIHVNMLINQQFLSTTFFFVVSRWRVQSCHCTAFEANRSTRAKNKRSESNSCCAKEECEDTLGFLSIISLCKCACKSVSFGTHLTQSKCIPFEWRRRHFVCVIKKRRQHIPLPNNKKVWHKSRTNKFVWMKLQNIFDILFWVVSTRVEFLFHSNNGISAVYQWSQQKMRNPIEKLFGKLNCAPEKSMIYFCVHTLNLNATKHKPIY